MPIGKNLKFKLRDKKDHFVITLYKDFREKSNINQDSIILLNINGNEIIRIPNKDFHVSIPKRFAKTNLKNTQIKITRIWNKEKAKNRKFKLFSKGKINIKSLIPTKTIFGHEIFILDDGPYFYTWYSVGGGAEHIKIKNEMELEKLAELIGFYFGDGSTSHNIRSFRLNNCESSVLNYCLKILREIGIPKDKMKVQVIYSTPKSNLNNSIKRRCINYWSTILRFNKEQIISVNRSFGKTESLKYGSARVLLDNSLLVEVLLHGVLKNFLDFIKEPKRKEDMKILKGFLRGLAAAEGSVTLTKLKSLAKISMSFDPHSDELNLYKKILGNIDLKYGGTKGNELYIYGIRNFKIMEDLDLFKMHEQRREKFILGYKNHRFSKNAISKASPLKIAPTKSEIL